MRPGRGSVRTDQETRSIEPELSVPSVELIFLRVQFEAWSERVGAG